LESRFAGCEWTTQDAVSGILMHSYAPNISMDVIDYNPFEPWPKPGQPHARVSSCRSGPWTFARFGPALTTGGNDWTSGAFPFDVHGGDWATGPRLVEFLKKDEVDMYGPMPFGLKAAPASYSPTEHASVSGYYLGSTTAAGKMIPYPPLHKHHFHFLESTSQDTQEAILTMHGDAECEEAKGGPACGIRLFPDGYAMRVGRAFGMHAQVNDVRASGSPNLEHYFVAALRLDERPIRDSACRLHTDAHLRLWGGQPFYGPCPRARPVCRLERGHILSPCVGAFRVCPSPRPVGRGFSLVRQLDH